MSYKIAKWVDDHSPVRGAALSLLRVMARMVHDDNVFWCKNTTLMGALRCSERSVQRLTAALVACGAIEKVRQTSPDGSGRQVNNLYRVLTPGLVISNPRPREGGRVTKMTPSHPDENGTLPLSISSPSPCQNRHPPKEQTTLQTTLQTLNGTTATARPREAAQAQLPLIGAVPPPPKSPPATFEDLALLREDIELLVELTGLTPERCLEHVSDGSMTAKKGEAWLQPAVRIDGMTADRVLRCRRDARIWVQRLQRKGTTTEDIRDAEARAIARLSRRSA